MNFDMNDMFGKITEMQQKMAETKANLGEKLVTAETGGGMVKVTANGNQRITKIVIEKTVIDPEDSEMLEDLVIAGVNKALDEAEKLAQTEMSKVAGGMMPPGMDLGSLGI